MPYTLQPSEAPSWWDFITKFDRTSDSFNENYAALQQLGGYIASNHPELMDQWRSMVAEGAANQKKLSDLRATRDYVYSWLQWLQSGASNIGDFLLSGAQSAYDFAKRELGLGEYEEGLGVVPVAVVVIGSAAAIAALVVIAKWITDAYTFAQRLNALQSQEAKGYTPKQAADIVNAALGPPQSHDFLGIPWSLLIWGAIAIVLGPPLLAKIAGGKK
ncbi:MAG: hypothetical protein KGJ13_05010 [Patescibacteria group bacterium]|nr:hypothetical protein [Patescibacteria group bacterium]